MYILFTAILSAVLCFVLIFPLWYFATTSPHLYTVIIITAAFLFLAATVCVKTVRRYKSYSTAIERKHFAFRVIISLLILSAAAVVILFSVASVLSEKRLIALIIFAAGTAAILVLNRFKARFSDV